MEEKHSEPHLQCKANEFIRDVKIVHKAVRYMYPNTKIAFRAIPGIHDTARSMSRTTWFNERLRRWCYHNDSTYLYSYITNNPRFWNPDRYHPSALGTQNMAQILFRQMDLLTTDFDGNQLNDIIHTITEPFATYTITQSIDTSATPPLPCDYYFPAERDNTLEFIHNQVIGFSGLNIKWRFPSKPTDDVIILLGDESLKYLVDPCINFPPQQHDYCLFTGMLTEGKMMNAIPELMNFDKKYINRPHNTIKMYKDPAAVILHFGIHDVLAC